MGGGSVMRAPSVGEAIAQVTARLVAAGIAEARLEAEILVREVAGLSREKLFAHPETLLLPDARQQLETLVARRATCEPLPYILGRVEFYSLTFAVTPAVLIPRPETEILIQEALPRLRTGAPPRRRRSGLRSDCGSARP